MLLLSAEASVASSPSSTLKNTVGITLKTYFSSPPPFTASENSRSSNTLGSNTSFPIAQNLLAYNHLNFPPKKSFASTESGISLCPAKTLFFPVQKPSKSTLLVTTSPASPKIFTPSTTNIYKFSSTQA